MKITLILIFLFSLNSFAQKKARNDDLRAVKTSFAILTADVNLSLESENGSYYLNQNNEKKFRITTSLAKETEMEFNSMFLKFKYELGDVTLDCKKTTSMNMLGEDFKFCNKDKKRTELLQEYIAKLNKYLK